MIALLLAAALDLGGGVQLETVRIPAGEFLMGENHLTRSLTGFFAPQEAFGRRARIDRGFEIGRYEVTVEQFRRFVEASGYQTEAERGQGAYTIVEGAWKQSGKASWREPGFAQDGRHPATCVSWNDAEAFCQWLSGQTKRKCRLPSEAELEYAQRGGTPTRYWWGVSMDAKGRWANVAEAGRLEDDDVLGERRGMMKNAVPKGRKDGYLYTAPAGSFYPNPFGLYDAIGNVWEYTSGFGRDGKLRGMRGGSWLSTPDLYRPSYPAEVASDSRTSTRGLRVVVEE